MANEIISNLISTSYTISKVSDGQDGRSIINSVPLYYLSASDTTPAKPTEEVKSSEDKMGIWTTIVPTFQSNCYYFSCTQNTYSKAPLIDWTQVIFDGTTSVAEQSAWEAKQFKNQAVDASIESVNAKNSTPVSWSYEYQAGTSPSSAPTGSWSDSASPSSSNPFLWEKSIPTLGNGSTGTPTYRLHSHRNTMSFSGTKIKGNVVSGTIFSSSELPYCFVGDTYLNTDTNNFYECIVEGLPSVAQWSYRNTIKGEQGLRGAYIEYQYQLSSSSSEAPTGTWSNTPLKETQETPYTWIRERYIDTGVTPTDSNPTWGDPILAGSNVNKAFISIDNLNEDNGTLRERIGTVEESASGIETRLNEFYTNQDGTKSSLETYIGQLNDSIVQKVEKTDFETLERKGIVVNHTANEYSINIYADDTSSNTSQVGGMSFVNTSNGIQLRVDAEMLTNKIVANQIDLDTLMTDTLTLKKDSSNTGKITGGDYLTTDDKGYLSNKGVYLDADGTFKATEALIKSASMRDITVESGNFSDQVEFFGKINILDKNKESLLITEKNPATGTKVTMSQGSTPYWSFIELMTHSSATGKNKIPTGSFIFEPASTYTYNITDRTGKSTESISNIRNIMFVPSNTTTTGNVTLNGNSWKAPYHSTITTGNYTSMGKSISSKVLSSQNVSYNNSISVNDSWSWATLISDAKLTNNYYYYNGITGGIDSNNDGTAESTINGFLYCTNSSQPVIGAHSSSGNFNTTAYYPGAVDNTNDDAQVPSYGYAKIYTHTVPSLPSGYTKKDGSPSIDIPYNISLTGYDYSGKNNCFALVSDTSGTVRYAYSALPSPKYISYGVYGSCSASGSRDTSKDVKWTTNVLWWSNSYTAAAYTLSTSVSLSPGWKIEIYGDYDNYSSSYAQEYDHGGKSHTGSWEDEDGKEHTYTWWDYNYYKFPSGLPSRYKSNFSMSSSAITYSSLGFSNGNVYLKTGGSSSWGSTYAYSTSMPYTTHIRLGESSSSESYIFDSWKYTRAYFTYKPNPSSYTYGYVNLLDSSMNRVKYLTSHDTWYQGTVDISSTNFVIKSSNCGNIGYKLGDFSISKGFTTNVSEGNIAFSLWYSSTRKTSYNGSTYNVSFSKDNIKSISWDNSSNTRLTVLKDLEVFSFDKDDLVNGVSSSDSFTPLAVEVGVYTQNLNPIDAYDPNKYGGTSTYKIGNNVAYKEIHVGDTYTSSISKHGEGAIEVSADLDLGDNKIIGAVADVSNKSKTTFAYSKSGLGYSDYTWLAAWNGYELRAVDKSQYLPSTGGTLSGQITVYSNNDQGTASSFYSSNAAIQIREVKAVTTGQSSLAYAPRISFHWGGRVARSLAMDSGGNFIFFNQDGSSYSAVYGGAVYGAVFNDLADFITIPDEDKVEPGYCYAMREDGHYEKTSKYAQVNFVSIESDTYGFGMGVNQENESNNKLHSSVAGYVLAYVDKEYPCGTPLTCTKNGYLTKMKKISLILHPNRVIATYWKYEKNDTWGTKDRVVQVNGRHWVKVR